MNPEFAHKVTGLHLSRGAYPYIRQSTLRQVLTNAESGARQYALRQRAIALGWDGGQVVVPQSTRGTLATRLSMHAREHWPDLARVKVRFRAGFRYRYLVV